MMSTCKQKKKYSSFMHSFLKHLNVVKFHKKMYNILNKRLKKD